MYYGVLADALAIFHYMFVAFVVLGELAILIGAAFRCRWARNPWFRWMHLAAIAFVAYEGMSAMECPLTTWERDLRVLANQPTYDGSFVANMVNKLMLNGIWEQATYDKIHIGFGVLVLLT